MVRGRCRVGLLVWLLRAVRVIIRVIISFLTTTQPLLHLIECSNYLQTKQRLWSSSSKIYSGSPAPDPKTVPHCTVGTSSKSGFLNIKGTNMFSGLEGLILGGGSLLLAGSLLLDLPPGLLMLDRKPRNLKQRSKCKWAPQK